MIDNKRSGTLLNNDNSALFPKLTNEQLQLLAKHGSVRVIETGNVLFRDGDATYDVMVVLEGCIAVEKSGLSAYYWLRLAETSSQELGQRSRVLVDELRSAAAIPDP